MPPHPQTHVDIAASLAIVWGVLTDFAAYPEWNPGLRFEGQPQPGRSVPMTVTLFGRSLTVPVVFEAIVDGRELRWRGGPRWLMVGTHRFEVQSRGLASTRVTQDELFRGVAVPLLWPVLRAELTTFYNAINDALKARAEQIAERAQSKS